MKTDISESKIASTLLELFSNPCSISRTSIPHDLDLYCSGKCGDATCFQDLCGACLQEYYDYQEAK